MRARHSLASFLLVLVKHFVKTIINRFYSFTFSVLSLDVYIYASTSRNIVEMRANRRFASFLLVSVKHFGKTIINCFSSFTLENEKFCSKSDKLLR